MMPADSCPGSSMNQLVQIMRFARDAVLQEVGTGVKRVTIHSEGGSSP